MESPEVKFVHRAPRHENVSYYGYVDGKVFDKEWTTKTSVADCCMKVIKMLDEPGVNSQQVKG